MENELGELYLPDLDQASVYFELENLDEAFHRASSNRLFINDYNIATLEDRERLRSMINRVYTGEYLSAIPTCDCGEVTGRASLGVVCSTCHTEVAAPLEQRIESNLWFRQPKSVSRLINPIALNMISRQFTRSRYNYIRWICDPSYPDPLPNNKQAMKIIPVFERAGFQRSYNWFCEHFDEVMTVIMSIPILKSKSNYNPSEDFRLWLTKYRSRIFCSYVALPNRAAIALEEKTGKVLYDAWIIKAVDAMQIIAGIDRDDSLVRPHTRQIRTYKALALIGEFVFDFVKMHSQKPGIFRKNLYGTRAHFTFRNVLTAITGRHHYEDVHVPWGVAMEVLRLHLVNKLRRRGFADLWIIRHLNEHVSRYDPLLYEVFQELLADAQGRIPLLINRNPSLLRGSLLLLDIVRIKTDPFDNSISISGMVLAPLNADFDGDEINCWLVPDRMMVSGLNYLRPKHSVFGLTKPFVVDNVSTIPAPLLSTLSEWLHDEVGEPTDEQIQAMQAWAV